MGTKSTEYQKLMEAINAQGENLGLRIKELTNEIKELREEASFHQDRILRIGGQGFSNQTAIEGLYEWRSRVNERLANLEKK